MCGDTLLTNSGGGVLWLHRIMTGVLKALLSAGGGGTSGYAALMIVKSEHGRKPNAWKTRTGHCISHSSLQALNSNVFSASSGAALAAQTPSSVWANRQFRSPRQLPRLIFL